MTFKYFSESEMGPVPRTSEIISEKVWGGLIATINSLLSSGGFGEDFPEPCPDGGCVTGTNQQAFALAMQAEIQGIGWPLDNHPVVGVSYWVAPFAPDTLSVLDFIQFCNEHVSMPIQGHYHDFFKHYHLSFNREMGRKQFRERINKLFMRNGLVFELQGNGSVIRIAHPILSELIQSPLASTGDKPLDGMLGEARMKFLSPNPQLRRESLERLWDSWERLKSLNDPANKKLSVANLLNQAATETTLRARLEEEARQLTDIGNTFMIRHSEVNKVPIQESKHIDWLFHRMFSLIYLLVIDRRDD